MLDILWLTDWHSYVSIYILNILYSIWLYGGHYILQYGLIPSFYSSLYSESNTLPFTKHTYIFIWSEKIFILQVLNIQRVSPELFLPNLLYHIQTYRETDRIQMLSCFFKLTWSDTNGSVFLIIQMSF